MVKEAAVHAEEDKKKRERIDARNQLDSLIYQTERTLGEQASTLDAATKGSIESALADAKKALESDDVSVIRSAGDALQRASHKLAEALYAKAAQAGGAGAAGGPGAGAGGDGPAGGGAQGKGDKDKDKDDVVEAEFEEVKE